MLAQTDMVIAVLRGVITSTGQCTKVMLIDLLSDETATSIVFVNTNGRVACVFLWAVYSRLYSTGNPYPYSGTAIPALVWFE